MTDLPMKHTPGPWTVSDVRTVEGEYMVVGGVGQEFGLIASCPEKADATAIASLPDLRSQLAAAEEWKRNQQINWPMEIERRNKELAAAESQLQAMRKALEALERQALQSTVNDPANEWGQEALAMTHEVLRGAAK